MKKSAINPRPCYNLFFVIVKDHDEWELMINSELTSVRIDGSDWIAEGNKSILIFPSFSSYIDEMDEAFRKEMGQRDIYN